jgi:hypothetical protein
MSRSTEDIFQDVAELVARSISVPWVKLRVEIDAQEAGVLSLQGSYLRSDNGPEISFPVNPDVARLLREFRKQLQQDGAELWKSAVLELNEQGQFKFQIHYD